MILIIKKIIIENKLEEQTYKEVPKIFYKLVKWFYEIRGYEVEVVDKDVI